MTEALAAYSILVLLIAGIGVALVQHERDFKRGTVTDPERSPLWWGALILVLVLGAYGVVAENDARFDATTSSSAH